MGTVTFRLSSHVRKNGQQQIRMWVYSGKTEVPKDTGFKVLAKQWDARRMRVRNNHPNHALINGVLDSWEAKADASFAMAIKNGSTPSAAKVAQETFSTTDLHQYLQDVAGKMTGETQVNSLRTFKTLQNMLKEFSPSLSVEEVTTELLEDFDRFLRRRPGRDGKAMASATVRKRMTQFKTAYDAHPKRPHPSPFAGYEIPSGKKAKKDEALEPHEIEALWNATAQTRTEGQARDIFLFSYYAAGMRPGDVISLTWEEIKETEIIYLEGKKEHLPDAEEYPVHVDIHPRLRELIARQPRGKSTVFGLLKDHDKRPLRKKIDSALSGRRAELKMIAARVGITKWISFKLARTTFARMANKQTGYDLEKVRLAMNHSKVSTTEIYTGRDVEVQKLVQRAVYGE